MHTVDYKCILTSELLKTLHKIHIRIDELHMSCIFSEYHKKIWSLRYIGKYRQSETASLTK